jgi:hypothetical protein
MSERRDGIRVGDDIQIRLATDAGETTFAQAARLSETGIFVELILPYPEGTELNLEFKLPGAAGAISTRAKVVSAQKFLAPDISNRTGNGLRFEGLDADGHRRIREFIADVLA